MAVEANTVASLFEKLKVDDPCVPPKPWESIPSESGCFSSESKSQSSHSLYHISALSVSFCMYVIDESIGVYFTALRDILCMFSAYFSEKFLIMMQFAIKC